MILVMLIGVLVAGTVEAGELRELPKVPDGCKLYQEKNGAIKRICDGDEPLPYACYQRMQEAMRMMDGLLSRQTKYGRDNVSLDSEGQQHWDATMRECVQ